MSQKPQVAYTRHGRRRMARREMHDLSNTPSSCTDDYSDAEQQWKRKRAEDDRPNKEFYDELCKFPNLFSLKSMLHDNKKIQILLQKQETELKGNLDYHLEKVRCHNLIILCLYLLGQKLEALDYAERLQMQIDTRKSIIFLTLKAMLQWECIRKHECSATMGSLHDLYRIPEYEYLLAVAESEKGYLLICIGPRGFLAAMDVFQNAIDNCPESEIYLWKYDLALAIRRNFNICVYSKHAEFSPSNLGGRALDLLNDVVHDCPNEHFRVRALVELTRLVCHLRNFCDVCDPSEREKIEDLSKDYDVDDLFQKVLKSETGKKDFYVLRECGRQFWHEKKFEKAIQYLQDSCHERETDIAYQLLGRVYLAMYKSKVDFINPWNSESEHETQQTRKCAGDSALTHSDGEGRLNTEPMSGVAADIYCEDKADRSEIERLKAELDRTPYMDEDGNLLTTQNDGIGNICLHPTPRKKVLSEEEQRLHDEFDNSVLINDDGSYKTTEPDTIGNIRMPKHKEGPTDDFEYFPFNKDDDETAAAAAPFGRTIRSRSADEAHGARLPNEHDDSTNRYYHGGVYKTTQPQKYAGNIRVAQQQTSENKSVFQTSLSFPPSDDTRPRRVNLTGRTRTSSPSKAISLMKCKVHICHYDPSDRRIKTAEKCFLKGLEINPCNLSIMFDIGVMYECMGNEKKAVDHYQKMIMNYEEGSTRIDLVNAYNRSGLCYMEMSKTYQDGSEQERLKARAEDMFMQSLIVCRKAVAHLPQVRDNRAHLWNSYPQLLEILRESGPDAKQLQKEARVHELVGKHLEAVDVCKKMMMLANNERDRTKALQETVKNYVCMGNITEARYILDLFLTDDNEKQEILTATDPETRSLRDVAVQVYSESGMNALKIQGMTAARSAFRMALLMNGTLLDDNVEGAVSMSLDPADQMLEMFDLSLFFDDEGPEQLEKVSECVAASCREVFGMRVSINNEEGPLGHLDFDNELRRAESAPLVMLVVTPGRELHPRMAYIAATTLQSHYWDQVMLVRIGDSAELPIIFRGLEPFCQIDTLLALKNNDFPEPAVRCLLNFLLEKRGRRLSTEG